MNIMSILKNDLDNFSLNGSNENSDGDLIHEINKVDINQNKENCEVNNEKLDENNIVEEDCLNKTNKQEKITNKVEEIENNLLKKKII